MMRMIFFGWGDVPVKKIYDTTPTKLATGISSGFVVTSAFKRSQGFSPKFWHSMTSKINFKNHDHIVILSPLIKPEGPSLTPIWATRPHPLKEERLVQRLPQSVVVCGQRIIY